MHRRTVLKGLASALLSGSSAFAQAAPDPGNPRHHRLAAAYSAQHRGIALLVMVDGQILFEDYPGRGHPNRAHELASGTKSFSGVMAVAAVQDGLLSLEEPLAQTLTEWQGDPWRSQINLSQLLHLTSGIPGGNLARPPPTRRPSRPPPRPRPIPAFPTAPSPSRSLAS